MSGKSSKLVDGKSPLDSPAFTLILAANLLARSFTGRVGPEHDLTLAEMRCLLVLHANGVLSNIEVSDLTGIEKMTVSRALERLRQRGRVERTRDLDDTRLTMNQLTSLGHKLYRSVVEFVQHRQDAMARGLTVKELEEFDHILQRIVNQLRTNE